MSTSINHAEVLSPAEVHIIIESLENSDWIRLVKISRFHALRKNYRFGGYGPEELLNEAFLRALNGTRKCHRDLDFIQFMSGVMRSIVSSNVKTQITQNTVVVDFQEKSIVPDSMQTQDEESKLVNRDYFENLFNDLMRLFEGDEIAQIILEGDIEGLPKTELMELTQLDTKSFATKRKAIRRKIIREFKDERQ